MMSWSSRPDAARAFTLVEVMVVLVILALLAAGLAPALAAHANLRRAEETKRMLEEAKEALLGFAAAHGRLPCPADERDRGAESFAPGGDSANGQCARFHDGLLPAATLGLAPLDAEGFQRDAWGTPRNRIRYAVFGGTVNDIAQPLTRVNGMQMATLAGLGAASHYLFICINGATAGAAGCGAATNQLTRKAAFVLLSLGPNAPATPAPSSDEGRNLDGDAAFVAHETSTIPGNEFDDLVHWTPIHLVANRLLAAGRLP